VACLTRAELGRLVPLHGPLTLPATCTIPTCGYRAVSYVPQGGASFLPRRPQLRGALGALGPRRRVSASPAGRGACPEPASRGGARRLARRRACSCEARGGPSDVPGPALARCDLPARRGAPPSGRGAPARAPWPRWGGKPRGRTPGGGPRGLSCAAAHASPLLPLRGGCGRGSDCDVGRTISVPSSPRIAACPI
jgi:hypothetical protein